MGDIELLNYSNPPPGYLGGRSGATYLGVKPEESLAAAWAHYKERHDAPGLEVRWLGGQRSKALYGMFGCGQYDRVLGQTPTPESARAAAWAWYDRRLALAERWLTTDGTNCDIWPRCLTWSDAQVAEVERWLVDSTADLPEVLCA